MTIAGGRLEQRYDMSMALPDRPRTATAAERQQVGRAGRTARPRASLGQYAPAADRPDPVALLAAQENVRIRALLPLRHERMAASAFAFYRGGAAIMAADLGAMPNSGLVTQLCGDAHLSNFGLFAAPDRSLVFDVNDFDETHPGPFEWDVMRLAASFVLAARDRGMDEATAGAAAQASANAYRTEMARHAAATDLDTWYERVSIERIQEWSREEGLSRGRSVARVAARARARTAWSAISKMTTDVEGERRFLDLPPLLMPMSHEASYHDAVVAMIDDYRRTLPYDRQQLLLRYHVIDVAHKVVGVGSVGLLAFVVLMQGRDANDLLVLQAKQAVASVIEPYTTPSKFPMAGERVVAGQQLMQAASDIFLGWVRGSAGRDYYVRQLRDMKFAPDLTTFTPERLRSYATLCGRTLARAHARGGDCVMIHGYLGTGDKFDRGIRDFALTYAAQAQRDYEQFRAAIADGRVSVGDRAEEATYSVVLVPGVGIDVVARPAGDASTSTDGASAGPASN